MTAYWKCKACGHKQEKVIVGSVCDRCGGFQWTANYEDENPKLKNNTRILHNGEPDHKLEVTLDWLPWASAAFVWALTLFVAYGIGRMQ